MKFKLFWLASMLFVVLFPAKAQQSNSPGNTVEQQYQQLTWLTGAWTRTNMKPGRTAQERWEKAGAYAMRGWGITLKEKDTLFVEKLQLVIKEDNIWYVADVAENKEPVWFRMTAITPDGFTCENPAHDFPKKITYRREGEKMLATIEGDGRSMAFSFTRKSQ